MKLFVLFLNNYLAVFMENVLKFEEFLHLNLSISTFLSPLCLFSSNFISAAIVRKENIKIYMDGIEDYLLYIYSRTFTTDCVLFCSYLSLFVNLLSHVFSDQQIVYTTCVF